MADKDKFRQFIDELQKVVGQDLLPRDMLDFAQDMLIVGRDMVNSQVVIGDHNVINYYPQAAPAEKGGEEDEQSLVAEALTTHLDELRAEHNTVSENPYPGLLAYRLQDASHFFGRKQTVTELMTELEQRRVIWLHGRSGTGKSSLIQAGLMPALLGKNAVPVLVRSFDEYPTLALKKTLLKRRWSGDQKLGTESLLQFLSRLDEVLQGQQIYIFFDQFEEFVDKLPETKQVEFARELADGVADKSLPVHFIFSLLSDRFGETAVLRQRLQPGTDRECHVLPLKQEEARQAIVGPLEQFGISYQEGLVETILHHLGTTEVNSPQLQLVCEKLFHTLPEHDRQITFEHYRQLGEAKGIINDYLKQVLHDQRVIPASQFKAATYILSTLVTLDGKRDAKRAEDWYEDERLRILTFGWHVEQDSSQVPDSALAMQSMHPVTVANFIEQVRKHVSVQGEELRQIVNDMLNGYVRKAQRSFVDDVIRSLRNARLLHEIESDDGGVSYELVHEYLVPEVMGWLDEDEKKARQLRNRLNQIQLDFERHKLLLEPKELEIISSQLGNPKLILQESDRRLLLLSAAANGVGGQWLEVSGPHGLDWLREACLDETFPEAVRLGAASLLGEMGDDKVLNRLLDSMPSAQSTSRSQRLDLLASYLNKSTQEHHFPRLVNRAVFFRLAKLRIKTGAGERARMRRVAAVAAPLCALYHSVYVFLPPENVKVSLYMLTIISILAIVAAGVAYIFAEVITSASLVIRRWRVIWQALLLGGIGSLTAFPLYMFLSEQTDIKWFSGGIIGLALALIQAKTNARWMSSPIILPLVTGLFIMMLAFVTAGKLLPELSAALFAGIYVYAAIPQPRRV